MKVGMMGRDRLGFGSKLLAALAMGAGWVTPMLSDRRAQPVQRGYGNHRPTGPALRDPKDPVQAARIQAAVVKRERKAKRLATTASGILNRAYRLSYNANSLNPFYIAK